MRVALTPHPDTPWGAVSGISVDLGPPNDGALALRFIVVGDIAAIRLPAPAGPTRTDGLWRTTCFEAFVMTHPPAYAEFNLSPSGQWAAYAFDGYRAGMADLDNPGPAITLDINDDMLTLSTAIAVGHDPLRVGLSTVIETIDGAKSYWALAHPPGPPDFHHRDCFALELPPPREP